MNRKTFAGATILDVRDVVNDVKIDLLTSLSLSLTVVNTLDSRNGACDQSEIKLLALACAACCARTICTATLIAASMLCSLARPLPAILKAVP